MLNDIQCRNSSQGRAADEFIQDTLLFLELYIEDFFYVL